VRLVTRAPGKVNLCLFLGPVRADGRHEVVTVIESVSLADEVTYEPAEANEVSCPGVEGPNLAAAALDAYGGPPARIRIEKRVPVAAGMGGGSGDAAAALRLAAHAAGRPDDPRLPVLAAGLGADVPSQLRPGLALGTGAGEIVEDVQPREPHALLILPQQTPLSTPAVFAEADRLGLPRAAGDLAENLEDVRAALTTSAAWPLELLVNDLEPAARSLCPAIDEALAAARDAGADAALLSGSGPTVVGVFRELEAAQAAAARLRPRFLGAIAAFPVEADFAAVRELS
jgi:4-diphosphocytidyl-2-C-methyl-D-erythritol kinase